jgi:hypothetical protein
VSTTILYLITPTEESVTIYSSDPIIGRLGSSDLFLRSEFDPREDVKLPAVGKRLNYFLVEPEEQQAFSFASDWVVERVEQVQRERAEDGQLVIAWCKKSTFNVK